MGCSCKEVIKPCVKTYVRSIIVINRMERDDQMLGRTHVSLGIMTSLVVIWLFGTFLSMNEFNTMTIFVAVIGALLPDLDMGTSSFGGKFGIVKAKQIKKVWIAILILALMVSIIFLKNTVFIYGLLTLIFLGFICADKFARKGYFAIRNFVQSITGILIILISYYYKHYAIGWIGIVLLLLLFSKHRGLSHSFLFLIGATYAVREISLFYGNTDYSIVFASSMASHLLGDMATKSGIGLWIPLSNKRIKFPYTIKTGGKIEKVIFIASILAVVNILKII